MGLAILPAFLSGHKPETSIYSIGAISLIQRVLFLYVRGVCQCGYMNTFQVDNSCLLPHKACATVMQSTGKEQSIRIQSSGGLSEDQIQQMVRDAEAHAESDKQRKIAIEARNEAETAIISAERSVQVGHSQIAAGRHLYHMSFLVAYSNGISHGIILDLM